MEELRDAKITSDNSNPLETLNEQSSVKAEARNIVLDILKSYRAAVQAHLIKLSTKLVGFLDDIDDLSHKDERKRFCDLVSASVDTYHLGLGDYMQSRLDKVYTSGGTAKWGKHQQLVDEATAAARNLVDRVWQSRSSKSGAQFYSDIEIVDITTSGERVLRGWVHVIRKDGKGGESHSVPFSYSEHGKTVEMTL